MIFIVRQLEGINPSVYVQLVAVVVLSLHVAFEFD